MNIGPLTIGAVLGALAASACFMSDGEQVNEQLYCEQVITGNWPDYKGLGVICDKWRQDDLSVGQWRAF